MASTAWHRAWATLALLGVVFSIGVLAAAAIARRDLSVVENSMSYYAIGSWWFLQSAAFIAIGAASAALGLAMLGTASESAWMLLAAVALIASGVAGAGLAVYPMNAPGPMTLIGDTHQTAGTIAGVTQLVAALAFVLGIRGSQVWASLVAPAMLAFTLALTGAILTQLEIWRPALPIPMGAAMRLVVLPLIALWGVVAFRLRNAPTTRSSAAT